MAATRENMIKLKAHHPAIGKFDVYGINQKFVWSENNDSPCEGENYFPIEECKIFRFTGFTDCQGNEIYEGDKLIDIDVELEEGVNRQDTAQQVYWCDEKGAWMLDNTFVQDNSDGLDLWLELNDFRFKKLC